MQRYNVTADGGGEGKSLWSKFETMHQPKFFEIFQLSPQFPLITLSTLLILPVIFKFPLSTVFTRENSEFNC